MEKYPTQRTLLRAKLAALRNGQIPSEEFYNLIHDFGDAMLLEAEPDVVALLDHPNEQIRSIAVRVLTFHWDIRRHRDELVRLLHHDPDDEVKSITAAGLGFAFRDSRDPVVSRTLIDTIRNDNEDPYLRESAYIALRRVWSDPPNLKQDLADVADITADIRWQKVPRQVREDLAHEPQWMWTHSRLLKIGWEFVERIECPTQGESSGTGHPSTR